MKTVLIIIILIAAIIGAGYLGLPLLIKKETAGLGSEVQDMKQRLQKIEEFTKIAPLQPDADFQKVIKTVNATYYKVVSLEDSFKKNTSTVDEAIEKQKTTIEEAFRKHAEAIDKMNKDIQAKIQGIMFDAAMANIKGHILKARVEIAAKNVGIARSELDLINELFSKAAEVASDENKKGIKELQASLKTARTEIDTDVPSALNRIELLWHEMGNLLRKG
jgi:Skp family chaperone for outer membrane proteins